MEDQYGTRGELHTTLLKGCLTMEAQVVKYLRQPNFTNLVDVLLTDISEKEFGRYIGEINFGFRICRVFTENTVGIVYIDGVEFVDRKDFEEVVLTYPFVVKYFSDNLLIYLKEIYYKHKAVYSIINEESIQRSIRKGSYGR